MSSLRSSQEARSGTPAQVRHRQPLAGRDGAAASVRLGAQLVGRPASRPVPGLLLLRPSWPGSQRPRRPARPPRTMTTRSASAPTGTRTVSTRRIRSSRWPTSSRSSARCSPGHQATCSPSISGQSERAGGGPERSVGSSSTTTSPPASSRECHSAKTMPPWFAPSSPSLTRTRSGPNTPGSSSSSPNARAAADLLADMRRAGARSVLTVIAPRHAHASPLAEQRRECVPVE